MPIPIRLGRQPIDTGKIQTYFTKKTSDEFSDTYLMHKWDASIIRCPLKLTYAIYTFPQVSARIHPQTVVDMPALWSQLVKNHHLPNPGITTIGKAPIWDVMKGFLTFNPPLAITTPFAQPQMTSHGFFNSVIDHGAYYSWKQITPGPVYIPPQPGHTWRGADLNSFK